MGPKVESVLRFLDAGGKEAIITSYEHLCDAVNGGAGTHITDDSSTHAEAATPELALSAR
jgi:carbamate kinase